VDDVEFVVAAVGEFDQAVEWLPLQNEKVPALAAFRSFLLILPSD
jgi:hypothetical protein